MKYQLIYILIGSLTIILNIVLLITYLKLNFSIFSKRTRTDIPKESAFEKIDHNIEDSSEDTAHFDEDSQD